MDPFDLSIIFSAIRNFGDTETTNAVRGQQASTLRRVGSDLQPDDLRSMFLGRSDATPLMQLLGQNAEGSRSMATKELGAVNRALDDITSGGMAVQEELFDLMDERSSLQNVLGALDDVPGKRSTARALGGAARSIGGPALTALFAGLDAKRFLDNPTSETVQNLAREIANPVGSVLEGITGSQQQSQAGRLGGLMPGGDPRAINPIINAVADFLFQSVAKERKGDQSRRSPTGA